MHRTLGSRVLIAALAAWLGVAAGRPVTMVSCPMHQAPATEHSHHMPPSHHGDAQHSCCLGLCCCASIAVLVSRSALAPLWRATYVPTVAVRNASVRQSPLQHRVPFPTGPPHAARV
jgi:ABC-type nickel/cobalt efflux system permease component RcnA